MSQGGCPQLGQSDEKWCVSHKREGLIVMGGVLVY